MHDNFGQECNNCTACIAICPTDALVFDIKPKDAAYRGPGYLGHEYRASQKAQVKDSSPSSVHDQAVS